MQSKDELLRELSLTNPEAKVILVNQETGEQVDWNNLRTITSEEVNDSDTSNILSGGDIEIGCKMEKNNGAISLLEGIAKIQEMAENYQRGLEEALYRADRYEEPNPIYVPKHIKHRKKGRR